jgi:hypothetical protein
MFTILPIFVYCQSAEIDSCLIKWREDSVGCKQFRNGYIADSLIRHYNLVGKSLEEFKKIFGKENYDVYANGHYELYYLMKNDCDNSGKTYDCDDCPIYMICVFIEGIFSYFDCRLF